MTEPELGFTAVCPHAIKLPVQTGHRAASFRDLIWVKQMAFEVLSSAEECGYNPRVGERTCNAVGKPHYPKLLWNEALALIGPDVHLIHGRSWRGGRLCTAVFLCKDPKEVRGLKHPRCAFFTVS